jgi:predicted GNAT superfamily acetyltransferase
VSDLSFSRPRATLSKSVAFRIRSIDVRDSHRYMQFAELYMKTQGAPALDVWPRRQLAKLQDAGGSVLGAYVEDELAGLDVAVPGFLDSERVMISGGVDVASAYQGLGIGVALRWRQRLHALSVGCKKLILHIDPLMPRIPWFYIHKLGCVGVSYRAKYFGENTLAAQGTVDTDRLWCEWRLDSTRVRNLSENRGESNALSEQEFITAEKTVKSQTWAGSTLVATVVQLRRPRDKLGCGVIAPEIRSNSYISDPLASQEARESLRDALQMGLSRGMSVVDYVPVVADRYMFILEGC